MHRQVLGSQAMMLQSVGLSPPARHPTSWPPLSHYHPRQVGSLVFKMCGQIAVAMQMHCMPGCEQRGVW